MPALNCSKSLLGTQAWMVPAKPPPWTRQAPPSSRRPASVRHRGMACWRGSEMDQVFCRHREDDRPETVGKRLDVYHEQTQPLIDFYGKKGILKTVDGTREMHEVFGAIVEILG